MAFGSLLGLTTIAPATGPRSIQSKEAGGSGCGGVRVEGAQDESAGVEHRRIVVRGRLNEVPQQRVLPDHCRTLLLFRRNGLLAAILGVRNQNSELIDTGLEYLQIDRRVGKLRYRSCRRTQGGAASAGPVRVPQKLCHFLAENRGFCDPVILTFFRKLARCQVPDRAVWTLLVVVEPPGFEFGLCVRQ